MVPEGASSLWWAWFRKESLHWLGRTLQSILTSRSGTRYWADSCQSLQTCLEPFLFVMGAALGPRPCFDDLLCKGWLSCCWRQTVCEGLLSVSAAVTVLQWKEWPRVAKDSRKSRWWLEASALASVLPAPNQSLPLFSFILSPVK